MDSTTEKLLLDLWENGSASVAQGVLPSSSPMVHGVLPPGAGPKMTAQQVREALCYTRLNLKKAEVTGDLESAQRVKKAWAVASKVAAKGKNIAEAQKLINQARDTLLDQGRRTDYNAALGTYGIHDGENIDADFERILTKPSESKDVSNALYDI